MPRGRLTEFDHCTALLHPWESAFGAGGLVGFLKRTLVLLTITSGGHLLATVRELAHVNHNPLEETKPRLFPQILADFMWLQVDGHQGLSVHAQGFTQVVVRRESFAWADMATAVVPDPEDQVGKPIRHLGQGTCNSFGWLAFITSTQQLEAHIPADVTSLQFTIASLVRT